MTARRDTRRTSRLGATLATAALAMTGMAFAAAPASAGGGGDTECPPAASPPSPNTWVDGHGNYRGVRKISDERGPAGRYAMWSISRYETFGHDYYQRETWDIDLIRGATRTDCTREPRPPEQPRPRGGRGGSGAPIGGGGTLWMSGGTSDDEVRYGTVGEVEPL